MNMANDGRRRREISNKTSNNRNSNRRGLFTWCLSEEYQAYYDNQMVFPSTSTNGGTRAYNDPQQQQQQHHNNDPAANYCQGVRIVKCKSNDDLSITVANDYGGITTGPDNLTYQQPYFEDDLNTYDGVHCTLSDRKPLEHPPEKTSTQQLSANRSNQTRNSQNNSQSLHNQQARTGAPRPTLGGPANTHSPFHPQQNIRNLEDDPPPSVRKKQATSSAVHRPKSAVYDSSGYHYAEPSRRSQPRRSLLGVAPPYLPVHYPVGPQRGSTRWSEDYRQPRDAVPTRTNYEGYRGRTNRGDFTDVPFADSRPPRYSVSRLNSRRNQVGSGPNRQPSSRHQYPTSHTTTAKHSEPVKIDAKQPSKEQFITVENGGLVCADEYIDDSMPVDLDQYRLQIDMEPGDLYVSPTDDISAKSADGAVDLKSARLKSTTNSQPVESTPVDVDHLTAPDKPRSGEGGGKPVSTDIAQDNISDSGNELCSSLGSSTTSCDTRAVSCKGDDETSETEEENDNVDDKADETHLSETVHNSNPEEMNIKTSGTDEGSSESQCPLSKRPSLQRAVDGDCKVDAQESVITGVDLPSVDDRAKSVTSREETTHDSMTKADETNTGIKESTATETKSDTNNTETVNPDQPTTARPDHEDVESLADNNDAQLPATQNNVEEENDHLAQLAINPSDVGATDTENDRCDQNLTNKINQQEDESDHDDQPATPSKKSPNQCADNNSSPIESRGGELLS